MTKVYALHALLKHGPLTFGEMVSITGWKKSQIKEAKSVLSERRLIRRSRIFNGWYAQ